MVAQNFYHNYCMSLQGVDTLSKRMAEFELIKYWSVYYTWQTWWFIIPPRYKMLRMIVMSSHRCVADIFKWVVFLFIFFFSSIFFSFFSLSPHLFSMSPFWLSVNVSFVQLIQFCRFQVKARSRQSNKIITWKHPMWTKHSEWDYHFFCA